MELQVAALIEHRSLWICEVLNLWVNSSRSEYVTGKVISMSNKQMDTNQKCLVASRCHFETCDSVESCFLPSPFQHAALHEK